MEYTINPVTDALIIIDPQIDFCPGGALAVDGGADIMADIDRFADRFDEIIITQDWHPANHLSFAANHINTEPFATIQMPYGDQVAWPSHCVQGTLGAAFHPDLKRSALKANMIIRKGYRTAVDSYSAFYENDQTTVTGLSGYLHNKGLKRLFLVGLAYDFCVAYSALDAIKEGFAAVIVKNLTRPIDMPIDTNGHQGTVSLMEEKLLQSGAKLIELDI